MAIIGKILGFSPLIYSSFGTNCHYQPPYDFQIFFFQTTCFFMLKTMVYFFFPGNHYFGSYSLPKFEILRLYACEQHHYFTAAVRAVITQFAALVDALLGAVAPLRKSKISSDLLCKTTLGRPRN